MIRLQDINEAERDRAKVNKKGEVLCLHCEKYPAKISEYGMLRKCSNCEGKQFGPTVMINESGGRKYY